MEERRINWFSLFIKMLIIFIFLLIIIWLFNKVINKNRFSKVFINNINNVEKASTDYFKTIDLPLERGKSIKITLAELIDKNLIVIEKDKEDEKCDTKNSFSKIIRNKKDYTLETKLKCGKSEKTINKKFPLKDCKNCTSVNKNNNNTNTKTEEKNNNKINNTNNNVEVQNTSKLYYEYTREITNYSNWLRGNKTGDNIENTYEYYGTANKVYYTLGYIPANKTYTEYTIKLNKIPNSKYYFSKINSVSYFISSDEKNYLNNSDSELTSKEMQVVKAISQSSLKENAFTYELHPYYRKGNYYIDVEIKLNNTSNLSSYYDTKLKENIYYVPLKLDVKFDSDEITTTKPTGEYETITYYRYVEKKYDTIWSTENSLEGYTKTGNTKTE